MVDLAAREAGYWLIDVLVLGDIFGAEALDAVSGLGAAVEEERHGASICSTPPDCVDVDQGPRRSRIRVMDWSDLQKRLAETEERIANVERQIAGQRKVVAELDAMGGDAAHARYLLAGLELLRSAQRDSRKWLLKQLRGGE